MTLEAIIKHASLIRVLAEPGRHQHSRIRLTEHLRQNIVIALIDEQQGIDTLLLGVAIPVRVGVFTSVYRRIEHVVMLDMRARVQKYRGKPGTVPLAKP